MSERHALRAASRLRCTGLQQTRALHRFAAPVSAATISQSLLTKSRAPEQAFAPHRSFSASSRTRIDILETADKPQDAKQPEQGLQASQASPMSDEEYHERSDKFLEELLEKAEEKSEETGELDIEYAAGVMNITVPNKGTYVINKQPPNKQIWLSSPESGPKRFDWVVEGESMHQKADGVASGDWVYLRDGTSLSELLRMEIGIQLENAGRQIDENEAGDVLRRSEHTGSAYKTAQ